MSSVARPRRCSAAATARLRGLWRLLPEPCANSTRPARALRAATRSPASVRAARVDCDRAPQPRRAARSSRSWTSSSLVCAKSS